MAEQADFKVKNMFESSITVTRIDPGGSHVDTVISKDVEETFPLLVPEESLIVNVPEGKNTNDWPITIRSSIIDVKVTTSPTSWALVIVPNSLPPEVPTTVNITIGNPG